MPVHRALLEPLLDRQGLLGDAVWWQIAPHLAEWTCARYDRSGGFLAAISATGYVGVWDCVSVDSGYDLLCPSDWPENTYEMSASESAAVARISRALYASIDKSGQAVRAAARRTALAWGSGSRVLFAAMGHCVLALDVAERKVIASTT